MTNLYPIRYQDSIDLEGDNDDIITLLNPPEQRFLQSILNNVESNPEIFIADYLEQDTDIVDAFLAALMLKLMGTPVISSWSQTRFMLDPGNRYGSVGAVTWTSVPSEGYAGVWQLANAINNNIQWYPVALRAGTYIMRAYGRKGASFGRAHITTGANSHAAYLDFYNATTLANQIVVSPSFTVSLEGEQLVSLDMFSKHASSSGYLMQINWIELVRTGD